MELEDEKGMGDLYDFKDIAVRGRNPPLKYLKARMPPGLPLGSPCGSPWSKRPCHPEPSSDG